MDALSLDDLISMSQKTTITKKQYELGLKIGLDVTESTLQTEFNKMMSERKRIHLNPRECHTLLETLDYEMICKLLRRKVEYVSEITLPEYNMLMKVAESPRRLWISSHNHPITIRPKWEYGWQESNLCRDGKLWYLKSHQYFMVDIDTTENIIEKLYRIAAECCMTFRVYKTYAGYHVHVTSHLISSGSEQSIELMKMLDGDIWYSIYSQRCGFKIRLSPKIRKEGEKDLVGKLIGIIGKEQELCEIVYYLNVMEDLISWHENTNDEYVF